ncbi:hypothetical protein HKX48_003591 [Thoreauomyces humboldtii]|nr:hypothetical protein HKX48_003591 [Thoreauomyces humboldtii]
MCDPLNFLRVLPATCKYRHNREGITLTPQRDEQRLEQLLTDADSFQPKQFDLSQLAKPPAYMQLAGTSQFSKRSGMDGYLPVRNVPRPCPTSSLTSTLRDGGGGGGGGGGGREGLYCVRDVFMLKKDLEGVMGEMLRQMRVAIRQVATVREATSEDVRSVQDRDATAQEQGFTRLEGAMERLDVTVRGELQAVTVQVGNLALASEQILTRQKEIQVLLAAEARDRGSTKAMNETSITLIEAMVREITERVRSDMAVEYAKVHDLVKKACTEIKENIPPTGQPVIQKSPPGTMTCVAHASVCGGFGGRQLERLPSSGHTTRFCYADPVITTLATRGDRDRRSNPPHSPGTGTAWPHTDLD